MNRFEYFKRRAPWEEIANSGTEQLCAPMSSITLRSFNLVGHVIREEIEKTELITDGRTSDPFYKIISGRLPNNSLVDLLSYVIIFHRRIPCELQPLMMWQCKHCDEKLTMKIVFVSNRGKTDSVKNIDGFLTESHSTSTTTFSCLDSYCDDISRRSRKPITRYGFL